MPTTDPADAADLAGRSVAFFSWRDTRNPEGGGAERYLEKMAAGVAPESPEVLALARRWMALVQEFTGGDAAIGKAVMAMYQHEGDTLKQQMGGDRVPTSEMFAYIGKANAAIRAQGPSQG